MPLKLRCRRISGVGRKKKSREREKDKITQTHRLEYDKKKKVVPLGRSKCRLVGPSTGVREGPKQLVAPKEREEGWQGREERTVLRLGFCRRLGFLHRYLLLRLRLRGRRAFFGGLVGGRFTLCGGKQEVKGR